MRDLFEIWILSRAKQRVRYVCAKVKFPKRNRVGAVEKCKWDLAEGTATAKARPKYSGIKQFMLS